MLNINGNKINSLSINNLFFKYIYSAIIILFLTLNNPAIAGDGGSRASFTRGGWVGSGYVGMGKAGEIIANDVFAIYWNPAGLSELKGKKKLSEKDILERASRGKVGDITESDLIRFTEDTKEKAFLQIGVSAGKLDVERDVGFTGLAFDMFNGVFGIGVYSIMSKGIEERDDKGNLISDNLKYIGSASFLSYGWSSGISSIGISAKGLYEKIGDVEYVGAGSDIGLQVYFLPFLKIGFVIQDIGSGLIPSKEQEGIRKKYDFASPSFKIGASITSDTGLSIAVTGVKRLEQKKYQANAGLRYRLLNSAIIYLGINDGNFATGLTLKLYNLDISYALAIDKINYGYNNIVSAAMLF